MQENRRRLLDYLNRNPDTKLADIAYTTTARRMHEVLRVAYTVKSTRDVINLLRKDVSEKILSDRKSKPPPMNVVFTFTGQGPQYAGMGKQLSFSSCRSNPRRLLKRSRRALLFLPRQHPLLLPFLAKVLKQASETYFLRPISPAKPVSVLSSRKHCRRCRVTPRQTYRHPGLRLARTQYALA